MECEGKENAEDLGVEKLGKIWMEDLGQELSFSFQGEIPCSSCILETG